MDTPRSVVALFATENEGVHALEQLHDAGFKKAWLGVTSPLSDNGSFSEVVRERGGGRLEEFVRHLSGNGGESVYAVLTDHGVADDVSRSLAREMPPNAVLVIAGWTGDIQKAALVLKLSGGTLIRGADGGVIGTSRPRQITG